MGSAEPTRADAVVPRGRGEGLRVLRLSAALAVTMVLAAGARRSGPAHARLLHAYQRPFEQLPPRTQTVCRELRGALDEIALLRAETGGWPTVETLVEDEALPPFAPIWIVGGALTYRWRRVERAAQVSYLGRPARDDLPWLLLQLTTSPPGATHRRLTGRDALHLALDDGRLVHYGIWFHDRPIAEEAPGRPELRGWTQVILAGSGVEAQ